MNASPSSPPSAAATARKPLYYGWIVVGASVFIAFVSVGPRNGFGVFVNPMRQEFGWSFGLISLAATIGMLANGLFQPFAGWAYDTLGARKVIVVGLAIGGFCTLLLSLTPNLLFLIMVFGVIAPIGVSASSLTTMGALLSRWFRRRRAIALGIGTAGASLGGLVLVPFTAYLIEATDWRTTWLVLGATLLVLGVPVACLLRNDPEDLGLQPDGDQKPSKGAGTPPAGAPHGPLEVESWRDSLRSSLYWQLTGAYFVCGATTALMSVHFIPHAKDQGIALSTAAMAFGLMSGLNIVGVLLATALADRFPRKNLLALVYIGRGLGYAALLLAPAPWSIWAFAAIVGFSWWATAPLTTSLTADIYGLKYLGTLSGITFLAHQIGAAASIQLAGILRDMTGSYHLPFAMAGSLLVLATPSTLSIKEKKYSARYQPISPAPTPSIT